AQILDDAGYVMGPNGIRINPRTGQELRPLELLTPTAEESATSAELGVIIAEAAQAIGLPVVATPMDFNVIVDRINKETEDGGRHFDMYVLAYSLSRFPTHLYSLFHSDFDVDGGRRNPGMRAPQYDAAAERVFRPRDLAEACEAADEAQQIIQWVQRYRPLHPRPYYGAFRSDIVTGYVPHLGYRAASSVSSSIW